MKYAAPIANSFGWSLEETAAAQMAMADAGLKGSIAGQAFASSMARQAKPTKQMVNMMEELGISFFDANDKMLSMPNMIAELEKGTKGLTDKQRGAAIATLFGAEAYKHWAILLERGSDELFRMTGELENADGAAAKMAETMMNNLGGQWEIFKSGMAEAAYSIYQYFEPALRDAVKVGIKFAAIIPPATKIIAKFAKPFKPLGKAILIAVAAVASFFAVSAGIQLIAMAFALMLTPIGLVIGAITALVLGFQFAYKHIEPFRELIEGAGRGLKGFYALLQGNEGKGISLLMSTGMTPETYFKIKAFADGMVDAGKKLKQAKGAIVGFFDAVKQGGSADGFKKMLDHELDLKQIKRVYEFANKIRPAFTAIDGAFAILGGDREKGVSLLERAGLSENEIATALLVADGIESAFDRIKAAVKAAADFIGEHAGTIAMVVGAVAGSFAAIAGVTWIVEGLAAAFAVLSGPVGIALAYVAGIAFAFKTAYENSATFRDAVDGVISKVTELKDAIVAGDTGGIAEALGFTPEAVERISSAVDTITGAFDSIFETVGALVENVQPGVTAVMDSFIGIGDIVSDAAGRLMDFLAPAIEMISDAFGILAEIVTIAFNNVLAPGIVLAMSLFKALWKVVGPIFSLLGAAIEFNFAILKKAWELILKPFVSFMTGIFKSALEGITEKVDEVGGAFDVVGGIIDSATGMFKTFARAIGKFKMPEWVSTIGSKLSSAAQAATNFVLGDGSAAPSNYHGLKRVPYDGYLTKLHRNERVLTAREADAYEGVSYDAATKGGDTYHNATYNSVSNTQAGAKASKGNVSLTVNYQGGGTMDESEMHRFGTYLVDRVFSAAEGGAQ